MGVSRNLGYKDAYYGPTPVKGIGRKQDWAERKVKTQDRVTRPEPRVGAPRSLRLAAALDAGCPGGVTSGEAALCAEAGAGGADSWRLPADGTPWAGASPSWRTHLGSAPVFLYHTSCVILLKSLNPPSASFLCL